MLVLGFWAMLRQSEVIYDKRWPNLENIIVVKAMVRTIKWTARTAITLSFCLYIRLLIERSDNCEFIGYSFDHKDPGHSNGQMK